MIEARARILRFAPLIALFACTWFAFAPSIGFPFLDWDDDRYVVENPHIRKLSPAAVARLFAPTTIVLANWAPATLLSYAVDYRIGQLEPAVYHRSNVVLHALSAVLVLFLMRRLGLGGAASWLAALLFALHPIQVESVAWISERKNVLSLALALAALRVELGPAPGGAASRTGSRRVAAVALFGLALAAKATVVAIPLVLVAIRIAVDRRSLRAGLRCAAPYAALSLAFGLVTIWAQSGAGAIRSYHGGSAILNLATMARVVWLELLLFVDPGRLSAVYRPTVATSAFEPTVLLAVAASVLALWGLVRTRERRPLVFVFGAWYVAGLLPVLNLIPLPHLMADRFLYLSSIGLFGLVATIVADVARGALGSRTGPGGFPARELATAMLAVLVAVACLAGTRTRLAVWSGDEALWRDALAKTPDAEIVHGSLGVALSGKGEFDEAIEHLTKALELEPDYPEARVSLANALMRTGRSKQALELYREASGRAPDDVNALFNQALALLATERKPEGVALLERVVAADPRHGPALYQLGRLALLESRPAQALERLSAAVEATPEMHEAWFYRAMALGGLGRQAEAIADLQRAVGIEPDYARAHLQLGLAWIVAGDTARGRAAVARAIEIDPAMSARVPAPLRAAAGLP